MSGISVDPAAITGYATAAQHGSDELTAASTTLSRTPLEAAAFGEIGGTVGAPQAYARASGTLLEQLGEAAAALADVADSLRTIATEHTSKDTEHAQNLKNVHRA